MRITLILLIFAIGFSGYSAAAHAVGHQFCDQAMMVQIEDDNTEEYATSVDMSDCPEHNKFYQGQQKDADTENVTTKEKCIDCTKCCASQVMNLNDYRSIFFPQSSVLEPTNVDLLHTGDFLFSLKRPPKFII